MSLAATYFAYRPSSYPSSPRRLSGNDFLGSRTTSSGRRAMQPRISTSTKPKRPLDPMQWTDADLADYVQHHYESPQAVSLVAFLEQFRIHPLALWDLQSCHDDLSSLTNGDNALNQLVLRLAHQIRPVVSPSTPKPKPAWELSKELDIPSPPPPPPSPLPEEPELDEENNDAASTVSEWALDELPEQEEMRATGSDAGEPPVYSTTEGDYPEPMFGGLGLDTGVPSHTGYQEPQLEHAEEDLIHFDEEVQAEHGTHAAESGAEHENVEGDAQPTEPPHTDDIAEPASPLPAGATAGEDDASVHEREASQTPTGAETEGGLEEGGTREPADETTGDTPPQVDHPTAQDKPQPEDGVHDTETPEIAEEQVQTNVLGVEGVEEDVQVETAGSEGAEETSEEVHAQQETGLEALETTDSQQDPSTDATAAPVEVEEQHHTDNGQTTTPAEDDPASDTPLPDSNASSVQESHVDDDQTIPAEAEPASDTTSGDATGSGDQGGTTAPQEESAHTASSPSQETSADAAGSAAGGATPQSPPPTDTTSEGEQTTQEEALTGEEQSDTKATDTPELETSSSPSEPADDTAGQQQQPQEDASDAAGADSKLSSNASTAGSPGDVEVSRDAPASAQLASEQDVQGELQTEESTPALDPGAGSLGATVTQTSTPVETPQAQSQSTIGSPSDAAPQLEGTSEASGQTRSDAANDASNVGNGDEPLEPASKPIESSLIGPQSSSSDATQSVVPSPPQNEFPSLGAPGPSTPRTVGWGTNAPRGKTNPWTARGGVAGHFLGGNSPTSPTARGAWSSSQSMFAPQNIWAQKAQSRGPTTKPSLNTQTQPRAESSAESSTADQLASAMSESSVDRWRDAQVTAAAETVQSGTPSCTDKSPSPTSASASEPPAPAAASTDENGTSEKGDRENEDDDKEEDEQNEDVFSSVEEPGDQGGDSWQNVTKKGKTSNQSRGGTQSPPNQSNKSRSSRKADQRSRTTSGNSNVDTSQAANSNRGSLFGNEPLPVSPPSAPKSKREERKMRRQR